MDQLGANDVDANEQTNKQRLKKLGLASMILAIASAVLQLLVIIVVLVVPIPCRGYGDIFGSGPWWMRVICLVLVLALFMTPVLAVEGVAFYRIRNDTHWTGKYLGFHVASLVFGLL